MAPYSKPLLLDDMLRPVLARCRQLGIRIVSNFGAPGFYQSTGTEIFTSTPGELGKFQAAESLKWGRIIKAAGIVPE